MIEHLGIPVTDLRHQDAEMKLLLHRGLAVFIQPAAKRSAGLPGTALELPPMSVRMVTESGEKWFEVGFAVSDDLPITGNAAAGWVSTDGYWRFEIERSEDLVNWSLGHMTDCAGSPEDMGDGTTEYWSRSIFPRSSTVRTGQLWAESGVGMNPSVLNNPFTALTVNGAAQTLPNAPYTMPTDAAQLQTDIRAAGWPGAAVVATAATVWRIDIPNVDFAALGGTNKIWWPSYVVTDAMGSVVISGRDFSGDYVNADGVRTEIPIAFARLKVTQLKA